MSATGERRQLDNAMSLLVEAARVDRILRDAAVLVTQEVHSLQEVVRELVRNDGFYGGAPCWQEGSPAHLAFLRAMDDNGGAGPS